MSAFSSSNIFDAKNDVGGICLGSPTIIASSPRASAPTALLVGSCEASSKITRSNGVLFGSRYCATDSGLISIHGHNLGNNVGI